MTISTAQLAIGVVYAIFLWIAPDARKAPKITMADFIKMIPAGVCSAGAHAASVFALAAGGVAFGQIVKAAEPAFGMIVFIYTYLCTSIHVYVYAYV
jgi:solute carrier family 35 protein E1